MRGRVLLELAGEEGVLQRRRAKNTVLQGGAHLVAQLFAGRGGPITHMGVGTSDAAPDSVTVTTLSNEAVGDAEALAGGTTAAISSSAFAFEVDEIHRLVRVRVRASLPQQAGVGTIREAGLLSIPDDEDTDPVLYNRVTFAPLVKGDDHDLTMFWEVEFPFGDLQWL